LSDPGLEIVSTMNIPSRDECYQLIREMNMLEHIAVHSLQVSRVAALLASGLRKRGNGLNEKLVQASALLHDITKARSFKTGELHSDTGCRYLTDRGYPEVGDIVRQHVRLDVYFESDSPTEAEIVNYADKRVLHDKIVPLQERMEYILQRYGSSPDSRSRLERLWHKSKLQETRIFVDLPFAPSRIEDYMAAMDVDVELNKIFGSSV